MDKEKYASGPSSWLDMHNFIGDLVASSASASGQLLKYPNQQSLRSAWETMGPEAAVPKASRQAPSGAARANQGKSMAGYGLQSGESSEESADCDEQQIQPYTCTCPGCPLSSLTGALSLQSLKPRENSSQAQPAVIPESTLSAQAKGPGAVPLSLGLCLGLGLSLEEGSSESVSTSTSGRPQQQDKASLIVKGPTQPVLEGDEVTLECVDSESQFNLSSLHFEKLSKHMQRWYRLDVDDYSYLYRRCFLYDVQVSRDNGRLFLTLPRVHTWTSGPYRCVADDDTSLDNSSTPFTISVHYMRDLSVYRSGVGSFARYFSSPQDLRLALGSDVELECSTSASETPNYFWAKEGEDWIVPSNKLRLEKVRDMDTGKYSCTAQHPTISSLMKRQTISITVLPEDAAWYKTTTGHITLMVSGLLVALFVVILSMTIFLCHQAKQRKGKGPIDDHSQKKPIYKNSVESLPSTTGDKEPLV